MRISSTTHDYSVSKFRIRSKASFRIRPSIRIFIYLSYHCNLWRKGESEKQKEREESGNWSVPFPICILIIHHLPIINEQISYTPIKTQKFSIP